ncbi:MAG: hypothetical protein OXH09_20800 [Gammaproteobacteria bacterium]|nr:hypothetical protein [Gammaproteobacteria bacterium]
MRNAGTHAHHHLPPSFCLGREPGRQLIWSLLDFQSGCHRPEYTGERPTLDTPNPAQIVSQALPGDVQSTE